MPRLALLVALLACLTGCYEDELTLRVQPDGSGLLTLRYRAGPDQTALALAQATGDLDRRLRVEAFAAQRLASVEGVAAWSDVHAELDAQGQLTCGGTAWFGDLRRLRLAPPETVGARWELRRMGERLEVLQHDLGAHLLDALPNPLLPSEELDASERGLLGRLPQADGWRSITRIELPTAIVGRHDGWGGVEGRTALLERDPAWADAAVRAWFERARALRADLDADRLSPEGAEAEAAGLRESLAVRSAACQVTSADPDPEFTAARAAAEAAWKTSPWKLRLAVAALEADAGELERLDAEAPEQDTDAEGR